MMRGSSSRMIFSSLRQNCSQKQTPSLTGVRSLSTDTGGVGVHSSSPAQKQKQALKDRALKANQTVLERRKSQNEDRQVTVERDMLKGHQTKNQMDRLVEDLIQEGMAKGAFDNLSGAGKPLPERPQDSNPYIDFTTHKMNQILADTGFTPQWVELQKEISLQIEELRKELGKSRQGLGPAPLSEKDQQVWKEKVLKMEKNASKINNKIQKFNLIVPSMHHQKFPVNLAKEAERIFMDGFDPDLPAEKTKPKNENEEREKKTDGLLSGLLPSLFNKS